ncbi:DUF1223 domain-containing protein [Aestuariicella hydrocarbonica]|uniref:DUF1223 domain-containing protein n=2 Tax=Pseudomaricurvus hydrocarbonicus TaxID=1470433 RepID=A0A9E5MMM9_9GAMM|nr:DUF1223 domain-containing protein [Aestuariicella hydrocarbonica]
MAMILTTPAAVAQQLKSPVEIITGEPTHQVFDSGRAQVTLLELFSSQGCSSCPPAERWISQLKTDDRLWSHVVPVVFHVDYWDYLGWPDPYASLQHSQRQRLYQIHGRSNAVYTPGFMLSGKEWTGWFQNPALPELPSGSPGQLIVKRDGRNLEARFTSDGDYRALVLNVAVLGCDLVTEIKKGENSGLLMDQDFVVLSHQTYKSSDGSWDVHLPKTSVEGTRAVAFWVSEAMDPVPIQATGGWLPP